MNLIKIRQDSRSKKKKSFNYIFYSFGFALKLDIQTASAFSKNIKRI